MGYERLSSVGLSSVGRRPRPACLHAAVGLVAVLALLGVLGLLRGPSKRGTSPRVTTASRVRTDASNAAGDVTTPSIVPAAPDECSMNAAADVTPANELQAENLANYAPASAPRPDVQTPSPEALIVQAESMGVRNVADPGPPQRSAPTSAVELPYAAALLQDGQPVAPGAYINPARCVWRVTVHAAFRPLRSPPGVAPSVYSAYTWVVDAATGTGIAVGARGTDLVD